MDDWPKQNVKLPAELDPYAPRRAIGRNRLTVPNRRERLFVLFCTYTTKAMGG